MDRTPAKSKRLRLLYTIAGTADKSAPTPRTEVGIKAELLERERIKNQDALQDIQLKRQAFDRLFRLLGIETVLIFAFAFLQATGWLGFRLEEWSFKLLATATLAQITGMLYVAVRYLFPNSRKK